MRKLIAVRVLFLVSLVSVAGIYCVKNPWNLLIFIPVFALIYGVLPIMCFYIKRATIQVTLFFKYSSVFFRIS